MKKILFILILPLLSYSQTWSFSEGGNAFDGQYKTASVVGTGNNYPYTKPVLVINRFNGDAINFYISSAGYFQEKTGIGVYWSFDNEPDVLYSTYDWSISSDGKTLFFSEFNDPNSPAKLQPIDFIEKLTLASKVSLRIKDNFGQNDIEFSLRGSTKAINSVIPSEDRKEMIALALEERDALNEKSQENQAVLVNLMAVAEAEMLSSSSLSSLKFDLESKLGIGVYSGLVTDPVEGLKSIQVEGDLGSSMFEEYGYVDLFYVFEDGSKEKILGTWKVRLGAPVYERARKQKEQAEKEQAEKEERDRTHLSSLLAKYQRKDLINHLSESIIDESTSYSNGFDISEISRITITISDMPSYSKEYSDCRVDIYLDNGLVKTISNIYLSLKGVDITKRDLKTIGGSADTPF